MTHQLLATQPASERIKAEAEALRSRVLDADGDSLYTLCVNAISAYDSDERREHVATIEWLHDQLDAARHQSDYNAERHHDLEEKLMRRVERVRTLERKVCEINSKIASLSHGDLTAFFRQTFADALKEEAERKTLTENLRKNARAGISSTQPKPKDKRPMTPSIGRIVHFYPDQKSVDDDAPFAAVITRVWDSDPAPGESCVNLYLMDDGCNRLNEAVQTSMNRSEKPETCAWMWPPRV